MGRTRTIVGLDVGTTKTCVVIGQEYRDTQLRIIGVGTAPSHGLKGGQIVDMVLTAKAIDEAVYAAEKAARAHVDSVIVGIAGGHLKSHSQHAQIQLGLQGRAVQDHHLNAVVRAAATLALPDDREIVAVIPKTFAVDHLTEVVDPRGLTGRAISVEAHVVTGAKNALANLYEAAERGGVSVAARVVQPLASARAVLSDDQRREGVAMVDIGGGTTDVAIYVDGACWHVAVIPMGGALVTADIARGLSLPTRVAEALKVQHGRMDAWILGDESVVEVPGFDHGAPVHIRRRDLGEVVTARMHEIFDLVRAEIARSGYFDILPAGVVLTGGGSLVPGLPAVASEILGLPVTLGRPQALWSLDDDLRDPGFSTAIGLVLEGAYPDPGEGWLERPRGPSTGVMGRVGGWVRSVVGSSAE